MKGNGGVVLGKLKLYTINLDKMISNMIHRPRVDGYPLYSRVDSQFETGDGVLSKCINNKWDKISKKVYNSPGNIKRIFITHSSVYIDYFASVIGDSNKSLKRAVKFPVDFVDVAQSMLNTSSMGEKPEYKVKGHGLLALYKPWVCSNIEEVFFDWSILLSEDIANMGMGNLFELYTQTKSDKMMDYTPIKNIFEYCCARNISNWRDRFPRLKYVGYISHLEEIYNAIDGQDKKNSLEDRVKPWCENEFIIQSVKNDSQVISIYRLDDINLLNTKFSIKEGLYLYDRDKLKAYANKLEEAIKKNRPGNKNMGTKNSIKSDIEEMLDVIYNRDGAAMAKVAIMASTESAEDRNNIFKDMSDGGKARYRDIIL